MYVFDDFDVGKRLKRLGSQIPNPQIATFAKGHKSNKLSKSALLRIWGTYLRTSYFWSLQRCVRPVTSILMKVMIRNLVFFRARRTLSFTIIHI
jgi:hypothetical protein